MFEESSLHRMQLAIFPEPFDSCNFILLMHHRECEARIDAPSIHMHGAGSALAVVASFLRSEETKIFAQRVEKRHTRFDFQLVAVSVDSQRDRDGGALT